MEEHPEEKLKAKEILDRFEKKREPLGLLRHLTVFLAVTASVYHLGYAYFHPFFALDHRALHWGFMSSLIFLLYPFSRRISPKQRPSLPDLILWLASAGFASGSSSTLTTS